MCGESLGLGKMSGPGGPEVENGGLIDCRVSGGYNSTPGNGAGCLDDSTSYKFSMCEFCLDWLMTNFNIPPIVSDYNTDFKKIFRPASMRVQDDEWRHCKAQHYFESERRDKLRMGNWAKRK